MSNRDNDGDEFVGFAAEEPAAETPETVEVTEVEADEGEGAEEPEITPEVNDEADEGDEEPEKGKRNKPAHKRIDELTKARREAERERDELRQRLEALESAGPEQALTVGARPDPNALNPDGTAKYEFGEADIQFQEDLMDWKVDARLTAERVKAAEKTHQAAQAAEAARLDASWNEMAEKAVEKYPDFKETVVETAKAAEWPLLPLSAIAVAGSEHGADVAHHLATNRDEATKLATLEMDFHTARDTASKLGLNEALVNLMCKPYLDRATEYYQSIEAKVKGSASAAPQPKRVTEAPKPPQQRVRGSGGQYAPDFSDDNADLDAIAKAMSR